MPKNSSKNYKITSLKFFEKQAKRLAKKYPSLLKEIAELIEKLSKEPFTGEPLGHDCYKIRIAIQSKSKGKSGGGRIITNVLVSKEEVFLLTIYDKSERESLSEKKILELLKFIR